MTTPEGELEAAWVGWSQALVSTLFPSGLGIGQRFAFGQTTLVVDFANADPQVANAEIFRIGDTVPAVAPNFVPTTSLHEAYGFFLKRIASPQLATAQANLVAANSTSPTDYNMPARVGMQPPAGAQPAGQPGTPSTVPTTFLPAYQLDTGFRAKYQEWQRASIDGRTRDGGVIRFSSTSAPTASPPAHAAVRSLAAASMRSTAATIAAPASAATEHSAPPSFFRILKAAPVKLRSAMTATAAGKVTPLLLRASVDSFTPAPLAVSGGPGNFSLEVSFTGLGTFMLGPAPWFSSTVVGLFKSQLSAADQALFFGPSGVLARRIYLVVIGFEPAVTLRFDDRRAFENAKTLLSLPQGTSIGIGPLSFDASRAASTGRDDTQTVTIGPTASTLPILLGVVSTEVASFPPVA